MVKLEFFSDSENYENYSNSNRLPPPLCLPEDPVLNLILKHKQDFTKVSVCEPVSLNDLLRENITERPESFPKKEVLGEEFTIEDYENLCKKLRLQAEQFKKHQLKDVRDKVERLKLTFAQLTFEEIFTALKGFEYNEDEVILYLTKTDFITQIRQQIAQYRRIHKAEKTETELHSFETIEKLTDNISSELEGSESESEKDEDSFDNSNSQKRSKNLSKKVSRLRLDDALANTTDMEGWSDARIKAYQSLKTNPNSYFYRFNAPGETQRNGAWSNEEHDLFMNRLTEVGADGQWGIFSMTIPGRVGYQCSNYYRKLIESGRIKDASYKIDEKGKAHFIGGKSRSCGKSFDNLSGTEENESDIEPYTTATNAITMTSDNNSDSHLDAHPLLTKSSSLFYENPLPGFIDSITKTDVVRPAISPYGHVLSYDTWLKCLLNGDRKNTCPLTNQPLHKRQLIFLTHENIEAYREKIRKE